MNRLSCIFSLWLILLCIDDMLLPSFLCSAKFINVLQTLVKLKINTNDIEFQYNIMDSKNTKIRKNIQTIDNLKSNNDPILNLATNTVMKTFRDIQNSQNERVIIETLYKMDLICNKYHLSKKLRKSIAHLFNDIASSTVSYSICKNDNLDFIIEAINQISSIFNCRIYMSVNKVEQKIRFSREDLNASFSHTLLSTVKLLLREKVDHDPLTIIASEKHILSEKELILKSYSNQKNHMKTFETRSKKIFVKYKHHYRKHYNFKIRVFNMTNHQSKKEICSVDATILDTCANILDKIVSQACENGLNITSNNIYFLTKNAKFQKLNYDSENTILYYGILPAPLNLYLI